MVPRLHGKIILVNKAGAKRKSAFLDADAGISICWEWEARNWARNEEGKHGAEQVCCIRSSRCMFSLECGENCKGDLEWAGRTIEGRCIGRNLLEGVFCTLQNQYSEISIVLAVYFVGKLFWWIWGTAFQPLN